jgi:hypothetical protein
VGTGGAGAGGKFLPVGKNIRLDKAIQNKVIIEALASDHTD